MGSLLSTYLWTVMADTDSEYHRAPSCSFFCCSLVARQILITSIWHTYVPRYLAHKVDFGQLSSTLYSVKLFYMYDEGVHDYEIN